MILQNLFLLQGFELFNFLPRSNFRCFSRGRDDDDWSGFNKIHIELFNKIARMSTFILAFIISLCETAVNFSLITFIVRNIFTIFYLTLLFIFVSQILQYIFDPLLSNRFPSNISSTFHHESSLWMRRQCIFIVVSHQGQVLSVKTMFYFFD